MEKERMIRLAQVGNHPAVEWAVAELVRCLKRMNPGLFIDVLRREKETNGCGRVIWVGLKADAPLPKVACPEWDDAIAIEIEESAGYITGTNPRSVLIAAYRFLEALGCRWVRPGEGGERIPQRKVESVTLSLREKAESRHRGVCIEGAVSYDHVRDMIDFLPKVGMNEYFIQFVSPNVFFERWYAHGGYHGEGDPYPEKEQLSQETVDGMTAALEAEIAKRGLGYQKVGHGWTCEPFGLEGRGWYPGKEYIVPPETRQYLAQIDGKRELFHNTPLNTNLCYSNPAVRERISEAICEYCLKNPQVDAVHFWLADAYNNHCECENCRKKSPADWYVLMLNELDEKMTRAGIKTRVVFLAYNELLWAPETERIRHPERFILMFAPISRSYGQHYAEALDDAAQVPPLVRNQVNPPSSLTENLAHLRRWQKQFSGDSFAFDYHMMWEHVADPGYEKCAWNLFWDMQDLPRIGLNGMVSCQTQRSFFPTALPFQMMAAALWNGQRDGEALIHDYYQAAYGPEGERVHECLAGISSALRLYGTPDRRANPEEGCGDLEKLARETERLKALLAAHREEEQTAEEWELLRYYVEYLTLLYPLLLAWSRQDQEGADAALERFSNYLWRHEAAVQGALDVQNVFRFLTRKLGIPKKQ